MKYINIVMQKNSFMAHSVFDHFKLSSSYPNIKPFLPKDFSYDGFLNFESCHSLNRSWGSSHSAKSSDYLRFAEAPSNSDLQPLTWLQKQSIIDIIPLDIEEEVCDDSLTPGHDCLLDPQMCYPREEVETQENSNIQDYVRFQAQRNNLSHQRLALRQHNSFYPDANHNYSYKVNGHTKPNLSYTQLIFMAIETCKDRAMTVNDIYQWCEVNYPYYKHIGPSWKNSLRHNLSINKSFRRMPRDGQISLDKCELVASDELMDDLVSQRDNKQGGPGRGAYWVVDEKERKNLLESIYRAQQSMPLNDRSEQRVDPPFSLLVNPPKSGGPLLCIDGRFTDASTYLQSRRVDEEVVAENRQHVVSYSSDSEPVKTKSSPEREFVAMMHGLTNGTVSSDITGDISVNLSTSSNSQFSKHENFDSESVRPKLKNRRKSIHEKVRSYTEVESSNKEDIGSFSFKSREVKHNYNMTSVNVVVAPHFDHIYARYQQFLPPAISSDMEKTAFAQQQDHDSNPDAEFLRNGYHEEDEEENNDKLEETEKEDFTIKIEKTEVDNQRIFPPKKLNTTFVSTRRKIKRALTQRMQKKIKRRCLLNPQVEVKDEMVEPINKGIDEATHSDGYNTDSTVPMMIVSRSLRRSSRVHTTTAKKRMFVKRNSKLSMSSTITNGRRYRSKRKRSRPLRIDESHEMSAIRFLANLERRHQQLRNIDNLYKLNTFLNLRTCLSQSVSTIL